MENQYFYLIYKNNEFTMKSEKFFNNVSFCNDFRIFMIAY